MVETIILNKTIFFPAHIDINLNSYFTQTNYSIFQPYSQRVIEHFLKYLTNIFYFFKYLTKYFSKIYLVKYKIITNTVIGHGSQVLQGYRCHMKLALSYQYI